MLFPNENSRSKTEFLCPKKTNLCPKGRISFSETYNLSFQKKFPFSDTEYLSPKEIISFSKTTIFFPKETEWLFPEEIIAVSKGKTISPQRRISSFPTEDFSGQTRLSPSKKECLSPKQKRTKRNHKLVSLSRIKISLSTKEFFLPGSNSCLQEWTPLAKSEFLATTEKFLLQKSGGWGLANMSQHLEIVSLRSPARTHACTQRDFPKRVVFWWKNYRSVCLSVRARCLVFVFASVLQGFYENCALTKVAL